MHASLDVKQKIIHRLKITRGHLNKVIAMSEDDSYCMDIIHQSHAIQNALKEVDSILLENHLKNCIVPQIKDGHSEEAVTEVMKVFKQSSNKI